MLYKVFKYKYKINKKNVFKYKYKMQYFVFQIRVCILNYKYIPSLLYGFLSAVLLDFRFPSVQGSQCEYYITSPL